MASENEKVSDIVAMLRGFAKGEELPTDEIPSFTSLSDRFEAAHQREVSELERKSRAANLKYRAEKARHTDTYKDARIKAQDDEITTLKREVAELRACLEQAYGDKIGTYTMKGNEIERWSKVLKGAKDEGQ